MIIIKIIDNKLKTYKTNTKMNYNKNRMKFKI